MYELVIKNGKIIDGSGNPWLAADVAIAAGKIVRIGQLGDAQTDQIIDAG